MIGKRERSPKAGRAYSLTCFFASVLAVAGCAQNNAGEINRDALANTSSYVVVIDKEEIEERSKGMFILANASNVERNHAVLEQEALSEGLDVKAEFPHVGGMLVQTADGKMPEICQQEGVHCDANSEIQLDDPEPPAEAPPAEAQLVQPNAPWGLDLVDGADDNNYTYELTGAGTNVYIIDTGVLAEHQDFGGRVSPGFNTISDQAADNTTDCNGHGTHVAGTAAGSSYGLAKGANIVPIRVFSCGGRTTNAAVIAGVDWVTANAVAPAVANMSLGGGASEALDAAVRNSINAGVTYVLAAGNNGIDAGFISPARVPEGITVGAMAETNQRPTFSNYGPLVDMFAPGVAVTSAWIGSPTDTNTISGTSMAAPHVAGAAALFLEANPTALPGQVLGGLASLTAPNTITGLPAGTPNVRLDKTASIQTTLPVPDPSEPVEPTLGFLKSGESMYRGDRRYSPDQRYMLVFQGDGHLVLYDMAGESQVAIWANGTHDGAQAAAGQALAHRLVMQPDGNLVMYSATPGQALWHTGTQSAGAELRIQNDGNIVVYSTTNAAVWHRLDPMSGAGVLIR